MAAQPVMTVEALFEGMGAGEPPTADDVSILWDGRRLDSREAVLEWVAAVDARRAVEAGRALEARRATHAEGPVEAEHAVQAAEVQAVEVPGAGVGDAGA